jgi:hypothetical protein
LFMVSRKDLETEVLCVKRRLHATARSMGRHDADDGTKSPHPPDLPHRHQGTRERTSEPTAHTTTSKRYPGVTPDRVPVLGDGTEPADRVPAQDETLRATSNQGRKKTGFKPEGEDALRG